MHMIGRNRGRRPSFLSFERADSLTCQPRLSNLWTMRTFLRFSEREADELVYKSCILWDHN